MDCPKGRAPRPEAGTNECVEECPPGLVPFGSKGCRRKKPWKCSLREYEAVGSDGGLECKPCLLPEIQAYGGKGCANYGVTKMKGGTWYGPVVDGKRSGRGVLMYESGRAAGSVFEGEVRDGEADGWGELTLKSSARTYRGFYRAGKRHGYGVDAGRGGTYEGEYAGGKRHGHGKYTFAGTGDVYEGDWQQGRQTGQGTYTWKRTGEKHRGGWADGKRHGKGTATSKDGAVIKTGIWRGGAFVGAAPGVASLKGPDRDRP